jgi:hypothetical protein
MFNDPEWSQWSNREIARRCVVHNSLVDEMRRASAVNRQSQENGSVRKYLQGGKVREMHVDKINAGLARESPRVQCVLRAQAVRSGEMVMATEREVLEAIDGGGFASQKGKDANFHQNYSVARLLNQRGYLMDFRPHRESSTAEGAVDFFSVAHLSSHGKARLEELQAANGQGEVVE